MFAQQALPAALTIAGSDSGGGAGIQADLKTFAAHGVHGLCALTALTAQHTRAITAVHVPDVDFLRAQIAACFDDFQIAAVKLGMLANTDVITTVAAMLADKRHTAIVLDPVMIATSGAKLLADEVLSALCTRLIPMATVITPNIPEAEFLLQRRIQTSAQAEDAVQALLALGAQAVLLKGGHLDEGAQVIDRFADATGIVRFSHPRWDIIAHGTGCTLAAAIAANICRGLPLLPACELATEFVADALQLGTRPGRSQTIVLNHFAAAILQQSREITSSTGE